MQMRLEGPIFKGLSFTFTFDQIYRLVYWELASQVSYMVPYIICKVRTNLQP
jgi:hypothetical protein